MLLQRIEEPVDGFYTHVVQLNVRAQAFGGVSDGLVVGEERVNVVLLVGILTEKPSEQLILLERHMGLEIAGELEPDFVQIRPISVCTQAETFDARLQDRVIAVQATQTFPIVESLRPLSDCGAHTP